MLRIGTPSNNISKLDLRLDHSCNSTVIFHNVLEHKYHIRGVNSGVTWHKMNNSVTMSHREKEPVINTGIVLIKIWAGHLPFTTFIMCRSWKKYSFFGTEAKFSTVPSIVSCTKGFISLQLPEFPTKFQGAFQVSLL